MFINVGRIFTIGDYTHQHVLAKANVVQDHSVCITRYLSYTPITLTTTGEVHTYIYTYPGFQSMTHKLWLRCTCETCNLFTYELSQSMAGILWMSMHYLREYNIVCMLYYVFLHSPPPPPPPPPILPSSWPSCSLPNFLYYCFTLPSSLIPNHAACLG